MAEERATRQAMTRSLPTESIQLYNKNNSTPENQTGDLLTWHRKDPSIATTVLILALRTRSRSMQEVFSL